MSIGKEKKIVFFIGTLGNGGAERVISILTGKYVDMGIPVEIVLYYDEEPFYHIHPDVNITYIERETKSKNILKNVLWLRRYVRRNAKVLVSFLAQFNMIALVAAFATGIPVVVADRNDPRHMPKQAPVRIARNWLYHLADTVVVQTQHNKDYFCKRLQKKCKIIYNPVNLQEKKGLALRTQKKHRIVSAARLMKQKNQLMLIDAFGQIKKEFPDYTLTIYGEGPFRVELEKRIRELGLEDSVLLPGKVQNVFESIADAELFVLSSNFEGMPNALIEAMCLGLPVISTEVSGATDLIEHGKNGMLVDVANTQELSDAMRQMLAQPELRRSCGQNALEINERLQLDGIIRQWQECFEK
jgi:glycosyltransferase involved in cell wall biosynthesis